MLEALSQEWFRPFLSRLDVVVDMSVGLSKIPRKGWEIRGVLDPEDDWLHTCRVVSGIWQRRARLTDLDVGRSCQSGLVHEYPEKIDGYDQITVGLPPELFSLAVSEKQQREVANMQGFCAPLGDFGKFVLDAFLEFEFRSTPAGDFAKQMDKFQVIEQAWFYESHRLGNVRAMDFVESSSSFITHPVLLADLAALKAEIAAHRRA
jgi:5'-deoxynucleotidase YfbR-like HD superfamily hydrolase